MDTKIIQPEDYKYYLAEPTKSFSPRRNQAIIQETIKETTKFFQEMDAVMNDETMNRIDILGSYGRYRFNQGEKTFKEYAGPALWKELIGEKILSKVRVADTVNRLNNNRQGMIQL